MGYKDIWKPLIKCCALLELKFHARQHRAITTTNSPQISSVAILRLNSLQSIGKYWNLVVAKDLAFLKCGLTLPLPSHLLQNLILSTLHVFGWK